MWLQPEVSFPLVLSQDYQQQMQKLDKEMEEVNGWIDGAEKKLNDMDSQGPNDTVLKVLIFVYLSVFFSVCTLEVRNFCLLQKEIESYSKTQIIILNCVLLLLAVGQNDKSLTLTYLLLLPMGGSECSL